MRRLSWILTVPLMIVAVVFAITNRAGATLNLWPLGITVEAPLFVLVLGSVLIGLIVGGLIAWLSAGASRRRARYAEHRANLAERELDALLHRVEREQETDLIRQRPVTGAPANDARGQADVPANRLPAARA